MGDMTYSAMPEETLYIPLQEDGELRIKGILRGSLDKPVVVMMHGRSGMANSLLQYLGARYLAEQGFSTLRLFMYAPEINCRSILDCTLGTHVADFDTVIEYLRSRDVKTIFATGHSYGGMTILRSHMYLDGAVLWDPSHGSYWQEHTNEPVSEKIIDNMVIGTLGKGYVLPKKLWEHERTVGDTTYWAVGKGYPLEIISAGDSPLAPLGKRYAEVADKPSKHVVLSNAHHQFEDSDEVMEQLLKETANWFKEILDARS